MISDPAALTAELNDPSTSTQRLVEIAGAFPEFGPLVAEHPNATVDVLSYLLKHGDDTSRKAAALRRARDVALITARQVAPAVAPPVQPASVTPEHSEENLTVPIQPLREAAPQSTPQPEQRPATKPEPQQQPASTPEPSFHRSESVELDADETRISQRTQSQDSWRFSIDGHGDVVFSGTDILIGRKPSPRRDLPQTELVTIPDSTKTVSKTHARMILREERWMIIDLDSTNGVFVESSRGEHRIVSGSEIVLSTTFALGDLRITISEA